MEGPNLVWERAHLDMQKVAFGHGTGAFGAWKGHMGHFEQGLGGHGAAKVENVDFSVVLQCFLNV